MNKIKKATSWVLFGIGHVTSLCITKYDTRYNDGLVYLYQLCMNASFKLQEDSKESGTCDGKD